MSKVVDILVQYQLLETESLLTLPRALREVSQTKDAAKKRLAKARLAARQHRESDEKSTLSTQTPLPMIDAHCHLFGQTLAGTGPGLDMITGIADSVTHAARMGYYGLRPDRQNADLILDHLQKFRLNEVDKKDAVACIPLQLDLAYTPLAVDLPDLTPNAVLPGDFKFNSEDDIVKTGVADGDRYYVPGKHYLWLGRDPKQFERQLEVFGAVCALYCGEIWPMAPFDPRRPNALDFVKKAIEQLGYVGVKLYSRCGWMPYENGRMYGQGLGATLDARLDALYTYCTTNDLPLVVHCSPTGFPPDGVVALPKTFFQDQHVKQGAQRYKPSGESLGFPPHLIDPKAKPSTGSGFALQAITYLANYCHYVQLSTSPYSWEPVLKKYPKLRLDLAHSGGTLGVYGKFSMAPDASQKWKHETEMNPFVLGANAGHKFEDNFRRGVRLVAIELLEKHLDPPKAWTEMGPVRAVLQSMLTLQTFGASEVYRQHRSVAINRDRANATAQIDATLASVFDQPGPWRTWLDTWKTRYPHDWTSKVTELVKSHDNVYTDVAYIAGGHETDFKKILDNLLTGAPAGVLKKPDKANAGWAQRVCANDGAAMAYKNMFATDWFMTVMDKLEPFEFWQRIGKSVDPKTHPKLWDLLATDNILRWINIGRSFSGSGMDRLEAFYKDMWAPDPPPLPTWWKRLKKHYADGGWSTLRHGKPLPPIPTSPKSSPGPSNAGQSPPPVTSTRDRRTTKPVNDVAVRTANETLWGNHPELNRRALTMGPEDAALRSEWMDAYAAAGGNWEYV